MRYYRRQHVETYMDDAQISDVAQLMEIIRRRAHELEKPITAVSHNNPSNSIYVHAIVVYG